MSSKYDGLKTEFDRKVKKLQDKCRHKESEWMEEWWAIGHFTGYRVRICKECNKLLEKEKGKCKWEKQSAIAEKK